MIALRFNHVYTLVKGTAARGLFPSNDWVQVVVNKSISDAHLDHATTPGLSASVVCVRYGVRFCLRGYGVGCYFERVIAVKVTI